MPIRPGRLLPSVIVGALVTGALALGAGTVVAAPVDPGDLSSNECIDPESLLPVPVVTGLLTQGVNGICEEVEEVVTNPGGAGGGSSSGGNSGSDGQGGGSSTQNPPPSSTPNNSSSGDTPSDDGGNDNGNEAESETDENVVIVAPPAVVARPAAMPAPDVRGGVAPNANLLSPGGAYGGLAATTPALGIGTLDPSLLLAPAGSPLRTLTGVDEGSPVTTVSDVQAMAFDNLPGGLGMPAVTGTLILSAFAAFALRHRVLHRARMAADADTESEADTAEIPAREPVS